MPFILKPQFFKFNPVRPINPTEHNLMINAHEARVGTVDNIFPETFQVLYKLTAADLLANIFIDGGSPLFTPFWQPNPFPCYGIIPLLPPTIPTKGETGNVGADAETEVDTGELHDMRIITKFVLYQKTPFDATGTTIHGNVYPWPGSDLPQSSLEFLILDGDTDLDGFKPSNAQKYFVGQYMPNVVTGLLPFHFHMVPYNEITNAHEFGFGALTRRNNIRTMQWHFIVDFYTGNGADLANVLTDSSAGEIEIYIEYQLFRKSLIV